MAVSVSWKVRVRLVRSGPPTSLPGKGLVSGARMAYNRNRSIWFHLHYTEPRFRLSTGGGRDSVGPKSKVAGGCDESDSAAERPLRADAQRNRARILEAAEAVFAAEGIEVPVDVIAEKAGVGVGTLYRHFPTKERLCEAILLERLADLTVDARALADADGPGRRLLRLPRAHRRAGCGQAGPPGRRHGRRTGVRREAPPRSRTELREAIGVLLRAGTGRRRRAPRRDGGRGRVSRRRHLSGRGAQRRRARLRPAGHRLRRAPPAGRGLSALIGRALRCSGRAGAASRRRSRPGCAATARRRTRRTWPVTHPMACRAMMTWAMSSASPSRPSAVRSATPASQGEPDTVADGPRPSIGVRVTPGATALTRRPAAPHSAAATLTSIDRAAFDAQ